MSRLFDKMIFLGNGEYSVNRCSILKRRLESAIGINCGLQQMPNNAPGAAEGVQEVEDTVRDIAMALLGKEITILGG